MSKYDGPSYFKKNNPKISPLNKKKKDTKKDSWVDQDSYFKNDYKQSMPKRVPTRTDLQEEAAEYMQTPSTSYNSSVPPRQMTKKANDQSNRFRSKHIPKSLQHLKGWATNPTDQSLLEEVRKRLTKEKDSYLLFEERLAPEIKQAYDRRASSQSLVQETLENKKTLKNKKVSNQKIDSKMTKPVKLDPHTQEKAERVQEELNHNPLKPNTGLHRSLSKIIAEDQEALESGKNNLGSLFSDKD